MLDRKEYNDRYNTKLDPFYATTKASPKMNNQPNHYVVVEMTAQGPRPAYAGASREDARTCYNALTHAYYAEQTRYGTRYGPVLRSHVTTYSEHK